MTSHDDIEPRQDCIAPDASLSADDSCALRLAAGVLAGWLLVTAIALGGGCQDVTNGQPAGDGKMTGLASWGAR